MNSPTMAPNYILARTVGAADTTWVDKAQGINGSDYEYLNILVVQGDGSGNASAQVRYWCDVAEAFVQAVPDEAFTSPGAGKSYAFSVAARGRHIMISLTGTVSAGTKVYAGGFKPNHGV